MLLFPSALREYQVSSLGLHSNFSYKGTQISTFSFIVSLHNLDNYRMLAFDGKFMGMRSLWEHHISESFFTLERFTIFTYCKN